MRHQAWGLLQVGITNDLPQRQRSHERVGWELLDVRGPMAGDTARRLEVAILSLLGSQEVELTPSGAQSLPSKGSGRGGPVGEAWWESDYPVARLSALVEAVRHMEWELP